MRKENDMLNTFMPNGEKEWEARLFIDKAIKGSTEYHLEAIARALSGKYQIKTKYAHDGWFSHTEHIEADNKEWIVKTKKYKWEAYVDSFVFYSNNLTGIYLKIISFWAETESIFPCGGATLPNDRVELTYKD